MRDNRPRPLEAYGARVTQCMQRLLAPDHELRSKGAVQVTLPSTL
jgi:hypothetical protein